MFELQKPTSIQELKSELLYQKQTRLFVKREDQIDPIISGNKFRKLKYNFIKARGSGINKLISFGGAYSNHIHALAYAGMKNGFQTIGIIRGEKTEALNPTLKDAEKFGMQLEFISRENYRQKNEAAFLDNLKEKYGNHVIIPEGGSNTLAVKGCAEIIPEIDTDYDVICSCCGTGGTLAGLISGLGGDKKILGFPVLKNGDFLNNTIENLICDYSGKNFKNWKLITGYHFGGYAKYNWDLITFINEFKKEFRIPLDPVYTGKMFYGLFDLVRKDYFPGGSTVLAVHTGGLQGIRGFNERFGELVK